MNNEMNEFENKPLFDDMLSLTRCFGIDLSQKLDKTSKEKIEEIGFQKAKSLIITITMDETFIFCLVWFVLKLFEEYPENNCQVGDYFFKNNIIHFSAYYSYFAQLDETRSKTFNPINFRDLLLKRYNEYKKYYVLSDLVFACYYLEIMNNSTRKLEYYDCSKNIFDEKKLKMNAIEDIKWLDDKIKELVQEYIIANK